MKSRIIVRCSCGAVWSEDNTPESAEHQWEILDALDPALRAAAEKRDLGRTVELALRVLWARHSLFAEERSGHPHNKVRITEEVTIEDLDDLTATALPSRQEKERKARSGETRSPHRDRVGRAAGNRPRREK